MPKVCDSCNYYSTDSDPVACPKCGLGLRFTLLPPQGQQAAPLPNAGPSLQTATSRARRHKEGFLEGLGITEINPRYIWAGFIILVGVVGFAVREYQTAERLEQVKPGMHISQAARIIDSGEGFYNDEGTRFRDAFDQNDRSNGAFEYQDGPHHMIIRWVNGYITSVEKKRGAGPGDGTITIVDDDDEDR
jgi:hypothetical protein